ncbi:MAG: YvcK family protein [Candidatus Omnitrophica bacterium]|nr:YvcK family protein [Candidatus Omnitrophota bacterium]
MDKKLKKKILQLLKPLKWFYPGMGVKRWYLFSFIGIVIIVTGSLFLSNPAKVNQIFGAGFLFLGIAILIVGINRVILTFTTVLSPKDELVDLIFQKRHLERGLKIVTIGGGTGLSTLLEGLKQYTNNITAIVTVADEGGSSGKLRREFDVLPPGDIRNCLVALADTSPLMEELFQYRFDEKSTLSGHSFGNIFILAMSRVAKDFEEAVKQSSKILAIRGQVVPSTLNNVRLVAELEDGTTTRGENLITERSNPSPIKKLYLEPAHCEPTKSALEAIKNADAIVLGPGSLYTSIIPNLLVDSMTEAINSSPAPKICVCNIMTQHGETDGYEASKHIKGILKNTKIDKIDYCVVNNANIPKQLADRYAGEKAHQVIADVDNVKKLGVTPIEDNIITTLIKDKEYIRHNPRKLAKTIIDIISIAKTEAAHRET